MNLELNIRIAAVMILTMVTAVIPVGATTLLPSLPTQIQSARAFVSTGEIEQRKAPIAISGDNVYIVWFNDKGTPNKNSEVMFKASTDAGKIFSNKTNLSNTPNVDSINAEIAASGNNVYVTWWERNQTSNEPVMRVSNDNGKTFGEKIMLSNNATTAKPLL
jgi:hypothetical protein